MCVLCGRGGLRTPARDARRDSAVLDMAAGMKEHA